MEGLELMCFRELGPEPSHEEMDASFTQWGAGSHGSAGQDISCSVATCLSSQACDLGSTAPQSMAARGCRCQRIHTGGAGSAAPANQLCKLTTQGLHPIFPGCTRLSEHEEGPWRRPPQLALAAPPLSLVAPPLALATAATGPRCHAAGPSRHRFWP
ncbi:hypothetical protein LEMLEM_LOCUS18519 [Lemmus lemmus]